ncbi:MAG: hypothetical protein HYZ16_06145 [Bacteroidetes bacterium]|nr:hypothetical protein [Bacteroidota bacterium]
MRTTLSIAALTLLLFIAACNPQEPDEPIVDYTDMEWALHGGDERYWLLDKELYNGHDITASNQACEMDNIYVFDTYGNYNIDAGTTTCTVNPEPALERGGYTLDEPNKKITLKMADTTFTADLLKLENTTLQWKVLVDGETIEKTFKVK